MLGELITANHDELVARARTRAALRSTPRPSDGELDMGVPLFLGQLTQTLQRSREQAQFTGTDAATHGRELFRMGFSVAQVVHAYGDVCQAVTELALELDTTIPTDDLRVFNGCVDDAIASAVTEYQLQREHGISRQAAQRLGILAHELRNALSAALLAFGRLSGGIVGPNSRTGGVLNRSLLRLRDLIDRSLSEVRLASGIVHLERVSIAELLQHVSSPATVAAERRGVCLTIEPVSSQSGVLADEQLLIGALENILQNAVDFTPRGGHVAIMTREVAGQIHIDVTDSCGGLPPGKLHMLSDALEQHGPDRNGLGLGLWLSRGSVNSIGGKLSVRDLPSKGCVFTIALPQLAPA